MNQWAFVIAAYAVTFVATATLVVWSLTRMRRAERRLEQLGER